MDVLHQYDEWVNVQNKSKDSFLCDLKLQQSSNKTPVQLIQSYFDHISNLHGLTYSDYDNLHKHCVSDQSPLNECDSASCNILSGEEKTELRKLSVAEQDSFNMSIDLNESKYQEECTPIHELPATPIHSSLYILTVCNYVGVFCNLMFVYKVLPVC